MEGKGRLRLLVAAGGTGGHLYPALAVAGKLLEIEPEAEVTFTGTDRGLESRLVPAAGFPLRMMRVRPLRGGGPWSKIRGLMSLLPGLVDSVRLLRELRPSAVMGVGGYASGPLLAVAGVSGVPTLLLEPNATPGLANRWLAPLVDAAALAWEDTAGFFGAKGFVTGNPVREEFCRIRPRIASDVFRLLVIGGSQGSRVLNNALVSALPHWRGLGGRLHVTHQTGAAEWESVRAAYRAEAFLARVEPYLHAMAQEYENCDLVISRAGAMTCSELAASGKPSILVPLPLAGGHQEHNANMMGRRGAARVILQSEVSGRRVAEAVVELMGKPDERLQMGERARSLARPEAARRIVERLLELAGRVGEAGR